MLLLEAKAILSLFWFFLCDSVALGWIGQEIVESPFVERSQFVTLNYFAYFLPILPLLGALEGRLLRRALSILLGYFCF